MNAFRPTLLSALLLIGSLSSAHAAPQNPTHRASQKAHHTQKHSTTHSKVRVHHHSARLSHRTRASSVKPLDNNISIEGIKAAIHHPDLPAGWAVISPYALELTDDTRIRGNAAVNLNEQTQRGSKRTAWTQFDEYYFGTPSRNLDEAITADTAMHMTANQLNHGRPMLLQLNYHCDTRRITIGDERLFDPAKNEMRQVLPDMTDARWYAKLTRVQNPELSNSLLNLVCGRNDQPAPTIGVVAP